jgi:hypothetical protein
MSVCFQHFNTMSVWNQDIGHIVNNKTDSHCNIEQIWRFMVVSLRIEVRIKIERHDDERCGIITCDVFCRSLRCHLCLWIVHSWIPLRFSLTFSYNGNIYIKKSGLRDNIFNSTLGRFSIIFENNYPSNMWTNQYDRSLSCLAHAPQ